VPDDMGGLICGGVSGWRGEEYQKSKGKRQNHKAKIKRDWIKQHLDPQPQTPRETGG